MADDSTVQAQDSQAPGQSSETPLQVQPEAPQAPAEQAPPASSVVGQQPSPLQQANALPSPGPTDMPRFQRTVGGMLKGMLMGLASGSGVVQGAVDPTAAAKAYQQQGGQTPQRMFQSARAAAAVANARKDEMAAQNMPQALRDEHDKAVMEKIKYDTDQFGAPDEVFDNTDEAAHEAMMSHVGNGGVPLGHIDSTSDKTYVWQAEKAAARPQALDEINKAGILTSQPGLAGMTADQYNAIPAQQKAGLWQQAQQAQLPITPAQDAGTRKMQILTAQRQLDTVTALPDDNKFKADLVKKAQGDVNFLAKADPILTGVEKQKQADAVAQAGAKAQAQAEGKLPSDIALQDAKNQSKAATAGSEWKPGVSADEKKKTELAENIAFNANEVNKLLARRPDIVGAVAGRYTNTEQMVGNNDPDISALGVHIHNIAMANSGVHGFRSQQGVEDTAKGLLNNFKNGPQAVNGAMKANTDSVQTFIDNARPEAYKTSSQNGGAAAYFRQSQTPMYASAPGKPRMQSVDGGKTWQAAQ